MEQSQQNSHTILLNNLKTHYWESGPASAPTIVILHGFRSSHTGVIKLARELDMYHLIIPDFPGYGQTDELSGQHTVAAYARFIANMIEQLNLTKITLLGHSFGAVVALAYAANHPDRLDNLVLISPIPKPNLISRASTLYYRIGQTLPKPLDYHWLTSRIIHRPIRRLIVRATNPTLRSQIMAEGEEELQVLKPNINIENYLSLTRINPATLLNKIRLPILVIAGNADPLTRLTNVKRTYTRPNITIKIIKNMGHFSPAEIPAALAQTTKTWLIQKPTGTIPSA